MAGPANNQSDHAVRGILARKSGIVAEWHLSAGIDDVLLEADEKKSKN